MVYDTGFCDTMDTTVVDVEITAEQVRERSLASRTFLLDAVEFSFVWREDRAAELV